MRDRWLAMFPGGAMTAFEPDAEHIARALIRTPIRELGEKAMIDVISFAGVATAAGQSCDRMLKGYDPQSSNTRALMAAARFAFERSPAGYVTGDVESRVLFKIESAQDPGVRGGGAVRSGPMAGLPAPGAIELTAGDVELGGRLFDRLAGLRS